MKIILWTLLLSPITFYGQELFLFVSSDLKYSDTVRFGFKNGATYGIDVNLGEKNDVVVPTKGLRVVQRDSISFNCSHQYEYDSTIKLWVGHPIYHNNQEVFDSEKNFRNYPVSETNRYFEVKVYGNYPNAQLLLVSANKRPINESIDLITTEYGGCIGSANFNYLSEQIHVHVIAIGYTNHVGDRNLTSLLFRFRKTLVNYETPLPNSNLMELYPNPAKNYFSIDLQDEIKLTSLQLLDISGRFITEIKYLQQIDVSDLPNGIYFIKAFTSKGIYIEKFLVNH